MTYIKQPQLFQSVPIVLTKVFYRGEFEAYQTTSGTQTYVWTEQATPAGEKVWSPLESTSKPERVEPAEYKDIPEELYKSIRNFYIGQPKKVYRGT